MIRTHDFNSGWWGGPVGIIDDPQAFMSTTMEVRQRSLRAYDWVELRIPAAEAPVRDLAALGFVFGDLQIPFRIGLGRVPASPSLDELTIPTAAESPFTIEVEDLRPFMHERYRQLPDITSNRLLERYARLARELIACGPGWCVQVDLSGRIQGWFLSHLEGGGLNLELAMLSRGASISGMHLYQRSLVEYARLGAQVGFARFSAENTDVLNIYARLGARFLPALSTWLWIR